MASIHRCIDIAASPDAVWDALRDTGALHTRLVRGFVLDCRLEPDADGAVRHLRFANGVEAAERIVDVSDERRRVAWSALSPRLTHHNASAQVFDAGPGLSRVEWVADLLPQAMAPAIAQMIEAGLAAMKKTLETAATPAGSR